MIHKISIKLKHVNNNVLNNECKSLKKVLERVKCDISGPVHLPKQKNNIKSILFVIKVSDLNTKVFVDQLCRFNVNKKVDYTIKI
jgi:ribosomal protein S10